MDNSEDWRIWVKYIEYSRCRNITGPGEVMSQTHKTPLEGIGGWLVLPLLLLIISPIRATIVLYRELLPIFTSGVWNALTTPGTHFYHPLWFPLLVGKTVANLAVALLALVT